MCACVECREKVRCGAFWEGVTLWCRTVRSDKYRIQQTLACGGVLNTGSIRRNLPGSRARNYVPPVSGSRCKLKERHTTSCAEREESKRHERNAQQCISTLYQLPSNQSGAVQMAEQCSSCCQSPRTASGPARTKQHVRSDAPRHAGVLVIRSAQRSESPKDEMSCSGRIFSP